MTNLKNPKEKIYLMLFEKPLNTTEISKRLYKKFNTKVQASSISPNLKDSIL